MPLTEGQWKVKVKTSDIHNAGTHAQVYITVFGNKNNAVMDSGKKELGQKGGPDFEQGKESEFDVSKDFTLIYSE